MPIRIAYWGGVGFLVLLAGLVAREMPRRRTWWRPLLRAPEEMQLLVITAAVCVKCVAGWMLDRSGAMPGVGTGWLVLFGLSGGVYGLVKSLRVRSRGQGIQTN